MLAPMHAALLGAGVILVLSAHGHTRRPRAHPPVDTGPAGELCISPIEVGEQTPVGATFEVTIDKRHPVVVNTDRGGWIGGIELGKSHVVRIFAARKVVESFALSLDVEHLKRRLYRSGFHRTWRIEDTQRKCPWAPGRAGAREEEP
jgi:hypothetical protein